MLLRNASLFGIAVSAAAIAATGTFTDINLENGSTSRIKWGVISSNTSLTAGLDLSVTNGSTFYSGNYNFPAAGTPYAGKMNFGLTAAAPYWLSMKKDTIRIGDPALATNTFVYGNEIISGQATIGTAFQSGWNLWVQGKERVTDSMVIGSTSTNRALMVTGNSILTGKVGINVQSPLWALDVIGRGYIEDTLYVGRTSTGRNLHVTGNAAITNKLGIGMNEPSVNLDVIGTGRVSSRLDVGCTGCGGSSTLNVFGTTNLGGNAQVGATTANANLTVWGKGEVVKSAWIGDSLAVGTPTPSARLDVGGDARVRGSLAVNTNATISGDARVNGKLYIGTAGWSVSAPDYVFAPEYNLAPIAEVESYVRTNRHLPGITSAKAMEDNGNVDLVQMNLDLLKKVEELTLYVIEQNRRIQSLESRRAN